MLEVDIPFVAKAGVTDVNIDSLNCQYQDETFYLQTSPEYFLKRLLATNSGDIYHLGHAYRNTEHGRIHNPEFTILEWYRLGFDHLKLMQEVAELIDMWLGQGNYQQISYNELLNHSYGVDIMALDYKSLVAEAQNKLKLDAKGLDRDAILDAFYSHALQIIGKGRIFIHDFPASQAALARLNKNDQNQLVASRFELAIDGIEIANGYHELTDASEQAQRFHRDNEQRIKMGKSEVEPDLKFLRAMAEGLPECAGVSIGVDRLLMLKCGVKSLDEVLTFSYTRI